MAYQITDEELANARAEINAMEIAAADRWHRLVRSFPPFMAVGDAGGSNRASELR